MRFTEKYLQGVRLTAPRGDNAGDTPKRRDLLDSGYRGLILRLSPVRGRAEPRRQFRYRYFRDGKQNVVILGDYGPQFTLRDAHALHGACANAARTGGDPRAVVDEHWKRVTPAPTESVEGPTVADVVDEFLTWAARERKRPEQAKYLLESRVLPKLGTMPVASVRRRDIVELLDAIVDDGAPVLANRVQAVLKQAFAVAADRDLRKNGIGIETIPPFPRKAAGGEEKARLRVLSEAEIRTLWVGLDRLSAGKRPKVSRVFAVALKILLVTAQRRGELAAAEWAHLTLEGRTPEWRIADNKSDRPHVVPLSPLAVELFGELTNETPLVFPSKDTDEANVERDRSFTKAARKARALLEMDDWRPHDLRRTARTQMAKLGVADAVAERVLNHGPADPMIGVYNQHAYAKEMRVALALWATEIERIAKIKRPPKKRSR